MGSASGHDQNPARRRSRFRSQKATRCAPTGITLAEPTGPAKSSAGRHPPKSSTNSYHRSNHRVVQRPVELAQFTSWAFTDRARASGLLPSMGSIGDCYDNAMIESFWGRVQTELLNRQRWRTRLELANALFEYLEIFHNRRPAALRSRHAHPDRIRTQPQRR